MSTFTTTQWPRWGSWSVPRIPLVDGQERLAAAEIEMESSVHNSHTVGALLDAIPSCRWRTAPEGSLRNGGFEVVFRRPLPLSHAITALSQAYPLFEGVKATFRAAVHAHFNVQDLTREDYIRACIGYAVREPTIYEEMGNGRDQSIFCVPWSKSNNHIKGLIAAYIEEDAAKWSSAIASSPKYSGLNLQATSVYGSLEFRHMQTPARSPLRSVRDIAQYMEACHSILEHAVGHSGRESLLKYADVCINALPRAASLEHLASVYGLLAPMSKVDVLQDGLSTRAVHTHLRTQPVRSRFTPYGGTWDGVPSLDEEVPRTRMPRRVLRTNDLLREVERVMESDRVIGE